MDLKTLKSYIKKLVENRENVTMHNEVLGQLQESVEGVIDTNTNLQTQMETHNTTVAERDAKIVKLQEQNMKLFLKVGEQQSEVQDPATGQTSNDSKENDDEVTYDDIVNDLMGVE